jgi:hypothetical protein
MALTLVAGQHDGAVSDPPVGNGSYRGRHVADRRLAAPVARATGVLHFALAAVTLLAIPTGSPAGTYRLHLPVIAAVVIWGIVAGMRCRRGRLPSWILTVDTVFSVGLLVAMAWLLPPDLVGVSGSWLFAWAAGLVLISSWRLRALNAWAVVAVTVVAYVVGSRLGADRLHVMHPGGLVLSPSGTLQAVGMFPALAAIGFTLARLLRFGTDDADGRVRGVHASQRRDEVDAALIADRRARRLMLHDTVLTTLVSIARGGLRGNAELVRRRAADDLAALRNPPDDGPTDAGVLAEELKQQAELRDLHAEITWGPGRTLAPVPGAILAAFRDAGREALSNVERHAGVDDVQVRIDATPHGLRVVISDNGAGFDRAAVRAGSTGLGHSLGGRMEAIGGIARVDSTLGQGTSVTLTWVPADGDLTPPPAPDEPPAPGKAPLYRRLLLRGPIWAPVEAIENAEPSDRGLVAGLYTRYSLLALAWIGHFWQALSLGLLLSNLDGYRSTPVALAGWGLLFVITFVQIVAIARHGDADRHAWWVAPGAIAGALLVLVDCTPDGLLSPANWPIAVLGWLLAVFAVRRPLWFDAGWVVLAAATAAITAVAWHGSITATTTALGSVLGAAALQLGALALVLEVRACATVAAAAVAEQAELSQLVEARNAVEQDRARRDRTLGQELVPLLTELSDGESDPDRPGTQRRCELAAAEVRAFIDHDDLTTPPETLDAIARVTRSARIRDIVPTVQLLDGLGGLSPGWQRSFAGLTDRLLAEALPGEATVTVRGSQDGLSMTLCFPTRTPGTRLRSVVARQGAELLPGRAIHVELEEIPRHQTWLEVSWPT